MHINSLLLIHDVLFLYYESIYWLSNRIRILASQSCAPKQRIQENTERHATRQSTADKTCQVYWAHAPTARINK